MNQKELRDKFVDEFKDRNTNYMVERVKDEVHITRQRGASIVAINIPAHLASEIGLSIQVKGDIDGI